MSKHILFCDFDGVLCHDRFWRSLPSEQFQATQHFLLGDNMQLIWDWMRGKYTAEEVNRMAAEAIGMPYEDLWRVFVEDCKTMRVSQEVLETLRSLRTRFTVILITANMDSFTRFTQPALRLDEYFDRISNSYFEGLLKTDEGGKLFQHYADAYGVSISDCVAFDDSPNVQRVFEALGGRFFLVSPQNTLAQCLELL